MDATNDPIATASLCSILSIVNKEASYVIDCKRRKYIEFETGATRRKSAMDPDRKTWPGHTVLKLPTDFVPHSLRHTFGTRLGESGADAFTIMKLMGHSTITVSQRYVHPSPEVERVFRNLETLNLSRKSGVGTISGTVEVPRVPIKQ
jgi:hypothetical protein